ncbi:MAG: UDP-N-acetylmuramoyl-tripeptide--D-alanyl-D-alanine ligase [Burkholderiaceae bacterium]|jgi:UDP-N-acetylmuramoyl-tripeptide--D-alanyl-D-alanine ligase|nr:MAG: UDP-N-acetylmuramoyl-tripeptide--D-alanyl-D-alanine ligase [Burkholderiaceae bacterium]
MTGAAQQRAGVAVPPMMTLGQAHAWLAGSRLVGDGGVPLVRVHSDTRTLQAGDLFVALRGERFDANDFLAEAKARGAAAAIAERGLAAAGLPGLEVADSRAALGALAAAWRARFDLPLIAVTGSNGKTTVTQMIAAILHAWLGEAAFATRGNLNNDVGLPLTLLQLRGTHRAAVVELGMNHPGEIATLAGIARPTVGLVNNAQREHQEFMATVEAVARENGSVIDALAPDGIAVFPSDDAYTPIWNALAAARRCIRFGADAGAEVSLAGTEWKQGHWQVGVRTPAGLLAFELHIAGRHNLRNALAAVSCALAAGAPSVAIAEGLGRFQPVAGRCRAFAILLSGREVTLVDDSYNANPDSVCAAIDLLAELPGPHLLVLGDMGEVGDQGPRFHAEVGAYARERGIGRLFTLGNQSAHAAASFGGGRHFAGDLDALLAAVRAEPQGVASVLVKGSRFMRMERVVDTLIEPRAGESGHAA